MAKKAKSKRLSTSPSPVSPARTKLAAVHAQAQQLAEAGDLSAADDLLASLLERARERRRRALVLNDRGTISACRGELEAAEESFASALAMDPDCLPAQRNRDLLIRSQNESLGTSSPLPSNGRTRVALVSFLFNWPSTGGGIVHTLELAKFLGRAGFAVCHFYAVNSAWGIGTVSEPLPYHAVPISIPGEVLERHAVMEAYRSAVEQYDPDVVILTDSWNLKPRLAEALSAFPCVWRFQAMECICPLNNVRLLCQDGQFQQCRLNQFGHPKSCLQCVEKHQHQSGDLHRRERQLAGIHEADYHPLLVRTLKNAHAVLVVNPLMAAILGPYSVHVVPSGFDPERFPETEVALRPEAVGRPVRLLFAGLVDEPMKGYAILRDACHRLWSQRKDFELWVTSPPIIPPAPFEHAIGWQSQADLALLLRDIDVLVIPTIAQEALGRTAVEAMGAGKAVVASRIGGLPFTVIDQVTGLLFNPGDSNDLAAKLDGLIAQPRWRETLGKAARQRFLAKHTWPDIIERHYRPLLVPRAKAALEGNR